ncbi:tRNA dimethylallyltransferase [Limimonas halophila]|uniref:tRNA dimethylallyltransferase n=1 Tax=Limimonas halophila TaxID=1082479 RepID=A0A1G7L208_9PROT|nr:tRNA (adenosine(37)-N6)-dimethylallyltransferase MiaA [Limimonas halophila]SDF43039.1 tRNA dimethylallyltransferase [Limimonas halophila]
MDREVSAAIPARKPVVAVTGPTASGKSGLALAVAEALGGTVINADSMQIYREVPVLTAAPTAAEMARAPHRLYGVRDAARPCSAEAWRELALREIASAHAHGRLPIVVGGTGLYLRALTRGIAPIPDVPADIRAAVRARQQAVPPPQLHAELTAEDPRMAARLDVNDSQRVARALEVVRATGRSLAAYQALPDAGAAPYDTLGVLSVPPKADVDAAADARFDAMLAAGAVEEVRALAARNLDPTLPAMRAVGVPPLLRHVRGEIDLDAAAAAAKRDTRKYAKRQLTWLRNQSPQDFCKIVRVQEQFSESHMTHVLAKIRRFVLTGEP